MYVWETCVCVCVWCPWRTERALTVLGSPGAGAVRHHTHVRSGTWILAEAAGALTAEPLLAHEL